MKPIDFTSNLRVDPRYCGLEPLLIPYLAFVSSQRSTMFCSNIPQALILNGCEPSRTMSGYEQTFGNYEFNPTNRDQDVEILAVIPKFKVNLGSHQVKVNPSLTVVYVGVDDGVVSYFNLDTYTKLSDHFGYLNTWTPQIHNLKLHQFIPKEMKFMTSPAHKGNSYCLGVNANIADITMLEVCEDAFIISQALADKMAHTAIDSIHLSIAKDQVPLNLYGSEDDYRFIPDIGETVNEDGILLALRKINDDSFITDMTEEALSQVESLHDSLYTAPPGSVITDVQVYTSRAVKGIKNWNNAYSQALKYQEQHYEFNRTVIATYEQIKSIYKISDKFNTLVTRAMGILPSKVNKIELMNKREPVSFIDIDITWTYTRKVSKGFKITGSDGSKGVVSDIWPTEDMPIDDLGFRADLIKSPESGFNRMNPSQFYEQFFNRAAAIVTNRVRSGELGSVNQALDYVLGFINKFNPNQKELMECVVDQHGADYVIQAIIEDGIYLIIPPFTNTIGPALVLEIAKLYNITETPVTFRKHFADGTSKVIRTKSNVCIGSKYVYLLGKIPKFQMSAIETGYVSQFEIPHKLSDKDTKNQHPIGQTPIRLGEDETALMTMSLGTDTVSRFMGVCANSPDAVLSTANHLLNDKHPTKLKHIEMTSDEVVQNNRSIGLFNHQLGAAGITINRVK